MINLNEKKLLIILLTLLTTIPIFASASNLYKEALELEEVKGDFAKAKTIYKKIVSEHVSEQNYVARSLYHIAIISEMYGEKNNAKSYYNMILSSYSNISGLKYLAANGIARLNKNIPTNMNVQNISNITKKVEKKNTPTFTKKIVNVDNSPFANIRYRHGKTLPTYIISLGEEKVMNFENGVKGLAVSDPSILKLTPTTSKITFSGQKIGKCEMAITDKLGNEKKILVFVINPNNLSIDAQYLVVGEKKEIHIENLKQVALDNDNISVSAQNNLIKITSKREGNVTLTLERTNGEKINVKIKIYKKYKAIKSIKMNIGENKNIIFENRKDIVVSQAGIIQMKIMANGSIQATAIKSGQTTITISGHDGSKLIYNILVK